MSEIGSNVDCQAALKAIDMLDIIKLVFEGWMEISPISLVRSWKILLDHKASDKSGNV